VRVRNSSGIFAEGHIGSGVARSTVVADDLVRLICYHSGRQPAHLRMYTPKTFRDVAR
jgi:hypothetical protein